MKPENFRPRLGMGWFADYVYIMCYLNLFSSPSGDGLVLIKTIKELGLLRFSSPLGDGLVHSTQLNSTKENFRPRVGIGWFTTTCEPEINCNEFSSPSGDGLVLHFRVPTVQHHRFSSPSGDGLVLICLHTKLKSSRDFRPRVGMGWFNFEPILCTVRYIFVPEWGWVGSTRL